MKRHQGDTGFRRRRWLVVGVWAVLAGGLTPARAAAQFGGITFDPTNFARNVLHYARRLEQEGMQSQALAQQVLAMRKLAHPNWRDITGTLAQMDALMQQGQALAYTLNSIDAAFQQTFPGTQAYRNYPTDAQTQSVRTLATLRGALDAAHGAAQDLPTSLAQLEAIKGQLGGIQGHEEALELNGTIGMYSAEELTLLRGAIAALTNVQAVYDANQVNGAAQESATIQGELTAMSAPGPSYAPQSLRVTP
jgi:type IV secretion system protein TrbJ